MQRSEELLGPAFDWRLRHALDRVQVPHSAPRYQSVAPAGTLRTVVGRAAPAVAIGVAGLLLTAYAATGSPNPLIWTQNAASAINSITHAPEPIPTAEPSSQPIQEPASSSSESGSERERPESSQESSSEASEDVHQPDAARSGLHSDD